MASDVTNDLKQLMFGLLRSDVRTGNGKYYVGLARADQISEPNDISSLSYQKSVRHTLQSVKTLNNVSFVVPNVPWVSGVPYSAYDDNANDQTNFYVVNSNNEVFLCVEQGKLSDGTIRDSIFEPTAALASNSIDTFATSDGYKWRYLYKISNLAYSLYRTADFIPVKRITESTFIPEELQQLQFQTNGVQGEIVGIAIDDPGSNYSATNVPSIQIIGDGSGAAFKPTIRDGKIVKVEVDSDGFGTYTHGSDYNYAEARLSSGDAVLRPIIGPRNGLHSDLTRTLRSNYIMFQAQFDADESQTLLAENDFHQFCVLRNLEKYGSDELFTGNTGNMLSSFYVTITSGVAFDEDEVVSNPARTKTAKVFFHDQVNQRVYYYQDTSTGFSQFIQGDILEGLTTNTTATINTLVSPDANKYSGDMLYINTISAVDRADTQTEDIRIVIQLG